MRGACGLIHPDRRGVSLGAGLSPSSPRAFGAAIDGAIGVDDAGHVVAAAVAARGVPAFAAAVRTGMKMAVRARRGPRQEG